MKTSPRVLVFASAILGTILAAPCGLAGGAKVADQPADAAPFSVDAATLFETVSAISEPDQPDVVVFLDERHDSFDASGRRDHVRHLIYKIMTQDGVSEMSSIRAEWEPWHQTQPTVKARVIDPDLSVHELDPKTLSVAGLQSSEQDVYTDDKKIEGPLPALTAGAVVEELFEIPDTQPLFDAGVADELGLDWNVPVVHSRVILDYPDSLPMHAFTRGPVALQAEISKDAGRTTWAMRADNLAARMDEAPFLPPDAPRGPEVIFSTGSSWQSIAEGYAQILDKQIIPDQAKDFAGTAVQGKTGRDAVIAAMVAKLHKEVRYTGVEFGQSSLVPETASEVLRRKYGDCKDKASLLVAMLRSQGIQAYVALLSAGPGEDIDPDAPGMGVFDHAIVYVPGPPDLWIDATDEYARVGHIPGGDQGRWALIVKPEQKTLALTPQSTSADNRSVETREFTLAEIGPAHVVETSDSWGSIEAGYRDYFDGDAKKVHDQLESYMKDAYLADKLTKMDNTDIHDFSGPFRLRLQADSARRGDSEPADAVVAIPLAGLTSRLPDYFTTEPDKDAKKPATPRTADFVLPEPYTLEWRYHITAPAGFVPGKLPDALDEHIGPAHLTAQFEKNPDGTVSATVRFDTGNPRMTVQEAETFRTGILALRKENAILIPFTETGEADLAAGRVREALQEFHNLAALHPKEALHQDQIARALLAGGMGELARAEAKHATELEPTSAEAYATEAFVLEHDLIGREYKKGFDLEGAIAAFQKAVELDPKNSTIRGNFAILLEHNVDGLRYGPGARLNDAIDQYRAIGDDLSSYGLSANLPVALMWAKRFPELRTEAQKEGMSTAREGQLLVARAVTDGAAAAISEAAQSTLNSDAQHAALFGAGGILLDLRMYPQAADLLIAGAQGNENAAALLAQANLIRSLKEHEEIEAAEDDPRTLIMKFMIERDGAARSIHDLAALFTPESAKYFDDSRVTTVWMYLPAYSRLQDEKIGLPLDVVLDMELAGVQINVDGSDALGYKVTATGVTARGAKIDQEIFVEKENGQYRIAAPLWQPDMAGSAILRLADQGNLAAAAQWLDWLYDEYTPKKGDDPLDGPFQSRFWKKGTGQDKDAIRSAAAAMMSLGKQTAAMAKPILVEARAKASTDEERQNFDLALQVADGAMGDYTEILPVARQLLKEAPDSLTAFKYLVNALLYDKRNDEAISLVSDRLAKNPEDAPTIRLYAQTLFYAGKMDESQEALRKFVTGEKAGYGDWNEFAWNFLVEGKVTDEAVQAAEKATLLSNGDSGDVVDTQAAIYAEVGKAAEAYTMETHVIDLSGVEEPTTPNWYVFGRIAEQYGEREAAIEDYKKCEAPTVPLSMTDSSYMLAQRRLKILEAAK